MISIIQRISYNFTFLLLCLLITTGISVAATHTVTNTDDAGPGSLRQTVADAVDGDEIVFNIPGASPHTIFLTTGQIAIDNSITITGPGADQLTLDGSDNDRIFFIFSDPTDIDVIISGLTLTNGYRDVNGTQSRGGCIYSLDSLTIMDCVISSCETVGSGGGINTFSELTILDSTISDNHANISGGGIFSGSSILTIDRSTISGNSLNTGSGGGINNLENLFMTNSTVSGNMATNSGGGTGGVALAGINNQISNCTIVDNHNSVGAGPGGLEIRGEIFFDIRGQLSLKNSMIAGNTGDGRENNCNQEFADITNLGGNISDLPGPGECHFAFDPDFDFLTMVGPLQNNGGPTDTHALLAVPLNGAIDSVTDCTSANGDPVAIDQRGELRPFGPACDIGAYELQPVSGITPILNPVTPVPGQSYTISAESATVGGGVTFIWSFNVTGAQEASVSTRANPDDICQGLNTPLVNPRIIRTEQADINGDASTQAFMPLGTVGLTIHYQVVDIANCLGSNVVEVTVDDPPMAVPPVLLPLNPGQAGQVNTLSATGATPNSGVIFIWGFNQQSVTANNICPGFQSGILNPRRLTTVTSDGGGNANLNVNVPANLTGISVVIQAVDLATCTGSNVNPETL